MFLLYIHVCRSPVRLKLSTTHANGFILRKMRYMKLSMVLQCIYCFSLFGWFGGWVGIYDGLNVYWISAMVSIFPMQILLNNQISLPLGIFHLSSNT